MLNFPVSPDLVEPWVPAGCELDFHHGRTFLSVVGFRFLNTRLLGVPIPFHTDFDEVNLRLYVRRRSEGELRRGVAFVKEIVPRTVIAAVARRVFDENYVALPMRHEVTTAPEGGTTARYEWRREGCWEGIAARYAGAPLLPPEGSEEAFVTEHYWGYSSRRDGSTLEYRVDHPAWRVWSATSAELRCDVERLYGAEFVAPLTGAPSSAFVADGSAVTVRRGARPVGEAP